jgi:transposase
MGRPATARITKPWPYRRTREVANRGGRLDHRLGWSGGASQRCHRASPCAHVLVMTDMSKRGA